MKHLPHMIAACLLLSASVSFGQPLQNVTQVSRSVTLSTSPALVATANASRVTLSIQNLSTSIAVCYSFTTATPSCGTAGTFTLDPGTVSGNFAFWPQGSAPNAALYMVGASGSPVVSVTEGF